MSALVEINYWAEGPTDRAAARKLIAIAGGSAGADYSRRRGAASGKDYLDANLGRFNLAARYARWLVLRDSDGECAAELATRLLAQPAPKMSMRIVVPAIETWLMADRDAFASLLSVRPDALPAALEDLNDAKSVVLQLAAKSRVREIRNDFLPRPRSGRTEGPGYANHLIRFINADWDPRRAAANTSSLRRAIDRLIGIVERI